MASTCRTSVFTKLMVPAGNSLSPVREASISKLDHVRGLGFVGVVEAGVVPHPAKTRQSRLVRMLELAQDRTFPEMNSRPARLPPSSPEGLDLETDVHFAHIPLIRNPGS